MDSLEKMDIRGVFSRLSRPSIGPRLDFIIAHAGRHHLENKSLASQGTPGTGQLKATCEKRNVDGQESENGKRRRWMMSGRQSLISWMREQEAKSYQLFHALGVRGLLKS